METVTSTPVVAEPQAFHVHIPDEQLDRLRRKLEDYELPDTDIIEDAGWEYGVSLEWVKGLRKYWLEEFDWRSSEAAINRRDNYKVDIDGINLHFVHQKSLRPDAVPLLLLHGWPGTFFEFDQVIEPLTNPPDGKTAFHVIIPSLPGFGFSSTPRKKGWTVKDSARLFDKLVTKVLGYESYVTQGGDWGSIISTLLSDMPGCRVVHLNMCAVPPPIHYAVLGLVFALPRWLSSRLLKWYFSPEEHRQIIRSKDFAMKGAGFFGIQATQPFTIGLALHDSPIGLLIWLGEKYHSHMDPDYDLPPSALLTTISIYYHTHTFTSSCLPYHENAAMFASPTRITDAVLGVSVFSNDIFVMPEKWVSKWHKNKLLFHRTHAKGGHFPALDNPDGLVEDLRDFVGENIALFAHSA